MVKNSENAYYHRSLLFANGRGEQFIRAFLEADSELAKTILDGSKYYKNKYGYDIRNNEIHYELIDLIIQTGIKHAILDPSMYYITKLKDTEDAIRDPRTTTVASIDAIVQTYIVNIIKDTVKAKEIYDKYVSTVFTGKENIISFLRNNVNAYYEFRNIRNNKLRDEILDVLNDSDKRIDTLEFYDKYIDVMEYDNSKWKTTSLIKGKTNLRINLKNSNGIPNLGTDILRYASLDRYQYNNFEHFYYTDDSGNVKKKQILHDADKILYNLYIGSYYSTIIYLEGINYTLPPKEEFNLPITVNDTSGGLLFSLNVKYKLESFKYEQFSIMTHNIVTQKLHEIFVDKQLKQEQKKNSNIDQIFDFYTSDVFFRNESGDLVYHTMGKDTTIYNINSMMGDNCYLASLENTERKKCDEFIAKCIFGNGDIKECNDYLEKSDYNISSSHSLFHPYIFTKFLDNYEFKKIKEYCSIYGCDIIKYEKFSDWLLSPSSNNDVQLLKDIIRDNNKNSDKIRKYFENCIDRVNKNPAILNANIKLFKSGNKCATNKPVDWLHKIGLKLRQEPLINRDYLVLNNYNRLNLHNFGTVFPNLNSGVPLVPVIQYGGDKYEEMINTSGYKYINELFMNALKKLESLNISLDQESLQKILITLQNLKTTEISLKKDLLMIEKLYLLYNSYGKDYVEYIGSTVTLDNLDNIVKKAESKLLETSRYERELSIFMNKMAKLYGKYNMY